MSRLLSLLRVHARSSRLALDARGQRGVMTARALALRRGVQVPEHRPAEADHHIERRGRLTAVFHNSLQHDVRAHDAGGDGRTVAELPGNFRIVMDAVE